MRAKSEAGMQNNGFPTSYNKNIAIGYSKISQVLREADRGKLAIFYTIESKPYSGIDYKNACEIRGADYTLSSEKELWKLQISPEEIKSTILVYKEKKSENKYWLHFEIYLNNSEDDGIPENMREGSKFMQHLREEASIRAKPGWTVRKKFTYHYLK